MKRWSPRTELSKKEQLLGGGGAGGRIVLDLLRPTGAVVQSFTGADRWRVV